jgi:hypothetical protein
MDCRILLTDFFAPESERRLFRIALRRKGLQFRQFQSCGSAMMNLHGLDFNGIDPVASLPILTNIFGDGESK